MGEKVLDRVVGLRRRVDPEPGRRARRSWRADRGASAARGGGRPRAHPRHGVRREARGAAARAPAGRGRDARALLRSPGGSPARCRGSSTSSPRWRPSGPARRARPEPVALEGASTRSGCEAAQTRLTALRLALGGKLPGYEGRLGPALAVVFEGWDASGKGGALKRLVEPLDPRHVRVASVRGADGDREAPPLSLALLARAARARRDDRLRPLLVRPRAGGAGGGLRDAGGVGARVRDDRRASSARSASRAACW